MRGGDSLCARTPQEQNWAAGVYYSRRDLVSQDMVPSRMDVPFSGVCMGLLKSLPSVKSLITVNCRVAAAIGAALIGRLCAGDRLSGGAFRKVDAGQGGSPGDRRRRPCV